MHSVSVSLKGDLADLTPRPRPKDRIVALTEPTSVKDLIESIGVPHTEIDLILLNNRPVRWRALVENGDHVEAHPVPPPRPAAKLRRTWDRHRLQERPLEKEGFVCDRHLGRLARALRQFGRDVLWRPDWRPEEILDAAREGDRAILTCDRGLLKRRETGCGLLVRSRSLDEQLVEVLGRFRLGGRIDLFGRCSLCNGLLRPAGRDEVRDSVPEQTLRWRSVYHVCIDCGHVYWEGTHTERIRRRFAAALRKAGFDSAPGFPIHHPDDGEEDD